MPYRIAWQNNNLRVGRHAKNANMALTRLRQKGRPWAMILMQKVFITVWGGKVSLVLVRSMGTKS